VTRLDLETRRHFPILDRIVNGRPLVYLDSAASSQKPRSVIDAMSRYYEQSHANVHRSIHTLGEEATELYELARDRVHRFIGAGRREEVIFTRGTTDGLSLVAETLGRTLTTGDEILVTEMEHHSNLIPWQLAAQLRGAVVRAIPVLDDGRLDLDAFGRLLGERTRVVAFAHVSNVLGTINPVPEICRRARAAGVTTVVDGAQAAPHLPLDVSALGCDFYAFSAHKMLGPTGIGVLWGRHETLDRLEPGRGGSEMIKEVWIDHAEWNDLPWRFEPGTPPIAEAVGLTAAIEYLEKLGMDRVTEHERTLAQQALDELAEAPDVTVWGPPRRVDRGAVVAFSVRGLHPHDVAALLDAEGIAVRAGHHCAQPLMRRCGIVGTARASFSVYTSPDDVSAFARAVAGLGTAL
jgi:cysteine desulfurase/selenocysteine lyase